MVKLRHLRSLAPGSRPVGGLEPGQVQLDHFQGKVIFRDETDESGNGLHEIGEGCDDGVIEGGIISSPFWHGSLADYAVRGVLSEPFGVGPINFIDRGNVLKVHLEAGALAGISEHDLFRLVNLAVIGSDVDEVELLAFKNVNDLGNGNFELSYLLRGCRQTQSRVKLFAAGTSFVFIGG